MNYLEILEILEKSGITLEDFAYEDYDSVKLGLGESEEIKQYGGEGCGDEWYSVKYFKDHNVYIQVDGWYSSYVGVEFYGGFKGDSISEVVPEEKTITVYSKK